MNTITFKSIPNALDNDKMIIIDGIEVGVISRGWLRNGGDQWITSYSAKSYFGAKTLKELKKKIAFNLESV